MSKRLALRIILIIAFVVVGFFFLLRSCLSKYDERSAIGGGSSSSSSQFLIFEKDSKSVIFSLVKYEKTVSYSQKGGIINKSVNNTYYAQNNDLATAAKISSQKIKNHKQIKAYPVEIIGATDNQAWLFAGELMAFDPFTLTKIADAGIIETKNPALKGKLINERRYYDFDNDTKQIFITAADGAKYDLNTTTLLASAIDDEVQNVDPSEAIIKELENITKQTKEQKDAAYKRLRENNRLFNEKHLSPTQYSDSSRLMEKETRRLDLLLDSMELMTSNAKETKSRDDDVKRVRKNIRRIGSSFGSIKVNCDTMNGNWFGLYSNEEIQKRNNRFNYESVNDEAGRNKLFTAALTSKDKYWIIAEEKMKTGDAMYLQGGFLLNKESGIPFHLPDGFLLVHKDIIGREGKIQMTRIGISGKTRWTINTGLKEFFEWQLQGNKLVITGADNENLSSGEVNVLLVIDITNGHIVGYDFFKDKVREVK
jgi:hypothetical protein